MRRWVPLLLYFDIAVLSIHYVLPWKGKSYDIYCFTSSGITSRPGKNQFRGKHSILQLKQNLMSSDTHCKVNFQVYTVAEKAFKISHRRHDVRVIAPFLVSFI